MRASWTFLGLPRQVRRENEQRWLTEEGVKVRAINNSGHTPLPGQRCTVEYMTTKVDDKPERVVLNAVWEA